MRKAAEIDGVYRYTLDRVWNEDDWHVLWVMLNPSTADAEQDDPTIRKCIGFTERWGAGGLRVVNLYAYRTAYPKELQAARDRGVDIVGPGNRDVVLENVNRYPVVVAAYGMSKQAKRMEDILRRGKTLRVLGPKGHPFHPLYQPYSRTLVDWRP